LPSGLRDSFPNATSASGQRDLLMSVPMTTATFAQAWLPPGTTLAVERIDADDIEARAASAGIRIDPDNLVRGRRLEYLAGRLAARVALQSLGAEDPVIGSHNGAPVWPEGYCGSISHSAGLAVAVAARSRDWRALGIDIEARFPAHRERILQKAMRADEFRGAQASTDPWVWTRAWAAKEAAFKCLSALGADLAFEALVPCWTRADRGEMHAQADGVRIRLSLDCRVQEELMWVVASVANAG
jgi:4'-phosphopantetheinyl transferase EntD